MRGGRTLGAGLVAAAALLWGGWALVLRPAGLTPARSSLAVLAVLAAPLPFALPAALRRGAFRDRGAALALLVLGVADAGNVLTYFAALDRGPVAVAVVTHYLAPLLVALVAPWVDGEPRSRRALLAAPASLLGLGLLVWRPGAPLVLGTAALGATSALFYAALVFAARRAGRSFAPLEVTALHAAVAAAALLLWSGAAAVPPVGAGLARVAAGALVCGTLASLLFYRGVALAPAAVAGALTYLEPLSASVVGAVALGEPLGARGAAGGALLLAAGAWVALAP